MEILTSQEFLQAFQTLTEARGNLKILEQQVRDGKSAPNSPSLEDIAKISKELDDLMNLLMAIRPEDDHSDFDLIEQKSLSILSTAQAYSKLVTALLEVQAKLEEAEKEYKKRLKANKEFENLVNEADEIKKNMKFLMDIITDRKNIDDHYVRKDVTEIENFKEYMKTTFGVDVRINNQQHIDTIV
jgi:hypothetical protein